MVGKTKKRKEGYNSPQKREKHSKVRKAMKKGKGVKAAHYASSSVERKFAKYKKSVK